HVVGVRDMPRDAVRRAPELLLDERPLDVAPALAAVLDGVQAAVEARGERGLADRVDLGLGQHAAGVSISVTVLLRHVRGPAVPARAAGRRRGARAGGPPGSPPPRARRPPPARRPG